MHAWEIVQMGSRLIHHDSLILPPKLTASANMRNAMLMLVPLLLLLIAAVLGADTPRKPESNDPVRNYGIWQQQLQHVSMRIETEAFVWGAPAERPTHVNAQAILRRDGDRIDLDTQFRVYGATGELEKSDKLPTRTRKIVSNGECLGYDVTLKKKKPRMAVLSLDKGQVNSDPYTASALDGDFPGTDGKNLADLLQLPSSKVHVRGIESVGAEQCERVSAETTYGQLTTWLAVNRGYVPVRVVYDKHSNDRWDGSRILSEAKNEDGKVMSSWTATLSDVVVSKMGSTYIPVSGKLNVKTTLADGHIVSESFRYIRSDIMLGPDFSSDKAAFVIDLPSGTAVKSQLPSQGDRQFVWKDSEVVEGVPEPPRRSQGDWWIDYVLIAFDVLLGVAIARAIMRQKKLTTKPATT